VGELSTLGEFDAFRILSELSRRGLVEEQRRPLEPVGTRPLPDLAARARDVAVWVGLAAAVLLAVATLRVNPFTPWARLAAGDAGEQLRLYSAQARLERLERALEVFYLDAGAFPPEIGALARSGYVADEDLVDPWGRAFVYEVSDGGYQLAGLDPAGQPSPALTIARTFNAAQRMMLGRGTGAATSSRP
jgi:hypothetical protein